VAQRGQPIVGIDVGSSKTCALIGYASETGNLEVAGLGVGESKGWRKGVIVNLDAVVLAIKKAVEVAESAAGVPVDSAYVGVGGTHVRGVNAQGSCLVANRARGVTQEDIRQAIRVAEAVALPPDRELLHVLPQEFLLDSQDGIRDPLGMVGTRLEANVHLITASTTAWQNVVTAVNKAGIEIPDSGTVFEALASAEASLSADERELGVGLIDLGAGSTDLVVYVRRTARYTASVPVGGDHFTNDIAVGLRTPIPEAEKMKRAWGHRDASQSEPGALEVPSVGERPSRVVSYAKLNEIIEPRALELIELIGIELERSGFIKQLGAGLVLAGGGARLGGFATLAELTLGLPVRVARPMGLERTGMDLADPAFCAVVGLVAYGKRMRLLQDSRNKGLVGKLWGALRGPTP
jgi:cell division protein FtsA